MRNVLRGIMVAVVAMAAGCSLLPTDPLESLPSDVRAFLEADPTLGVRKGERIDLANPNLSLFRITYGEPLDCPSGCFYATALVMRAPARIGWVRSIQPAPNARVFPVQPQDTATFTTATLKELRRADPSAHSAVTFMLACSPGIPDTMRERILRETPTISLLYCPIS